MPWQRVLDQLEEGLSQRVYLRDLRAIPSAVLQQRAVWVNADTLRALSVFAHSKTPSTKGCATQNEGFSLFSLIDVNVKTNGGSRLLRKWLRFPLGDRAALLRRQNHISWLAEHQPMLEHATQCLSEVRNLRSVTLCITSFRFKPSD